MQGVKLDTPRTIGEIARMAGVSWQKMYRHLKRLHAQDGSLLVRVGGQWMVTLASLRRVWPDFAKKLATPDDVRELVGEQERQHQRHRALAETVRRQASDLAHVKAELAAFRAKAHAWLAAMEAREIPLESGTMPAAEPAEGQSESVKTLRVLQLVK